MSTNDRFLSSVIPASPNEASYRYTGLQLQTDGHKWSIPFPLWGGAKVFLIYRYTNKNHKCQYYNFSHGSNTNTDRHICIQKKTNKNKLQVNNPESAELDKKKAVSYYLLPIHSGDLSWCHPTKFLKQRNVDRSLQAQVSTSPLEASTDFPAQAMVPQTLTQASVKEPLAEAACLGQARW